MHISGGPDVPVPQVQLLSNGRYHVMLTSAGGGYRRWKDLAVTRWREDTTCDNWGTFCYLRDVVACNAWSATHQPTLRRADTYAAVFTIGQATCHRFDDGIETHTTVAVSPDDDVELRRVRLTSNAATRRVFNVTSYAEEPAAVLGLNMRSRAECHRVGRTQSCRQGERSPCAWPGHQRLMRMA